MISRPKSLGVASVLVVIALNAFLLFVLIPKIGSHFVDSYTLNRYDGDGYDQIAVNLADGNGYRLYPDTARTLMREPGYPVLLAGVYKTFGRKLWFVQAVNLILALAAACLIMQIASRFSASRLLILGSPVLFLFHPETLLAESRGGIEILFGFMLTLYILTVYSAVKSNRWPRYLVSGAVLGLTCLVRSTPILFPVFLLGYLLVFKPSGASRATVFRNVAVMVVAMFVVLSPWIIRNYLLTKKFVPTASVLGVSAQAGLYLSTHKAIGNRQADTEASWERNKLAHGLGYPFKAGYLQYFYSSADEVAFSHYLFMRVLHTYEHDLLLLARTVSENVFFNFWCAGKTPASVAMDAIVQFPLLALALLGFILCLRNGGAKQFGPMVLLVVYIVAVSAPILAQARYSAPLIPFLSIFACTAFATFLGEASAAQRKLAEAAVPYGQHSADGFGEPISSARAGRSSAIWSRKRADIAVVNPDGNAKQ
jgi:hypothetical protein